MFVSRLSFDLWTRVMVIFNPIKYMSRRSTCPCNLRSRICCRLSIYSDYHQIMTSNDNYLHISIVTHVWDFLITTLYYDDASCWNKTVQHIGERTTLVCLQEIITRLCLLKRASQFKTIQIHTTKVDYSCIWFRLS